MSSKAIFIGLADTMTGLECTRTFLQGEQDRVSRVRGSPRAQKIYAGVSSEGGPEADALRQLGAELILVRSDRQKEIVEVLKKCECALIVPGIDSTEQWFESAEACIKAAEEANIRVCLVSAMGAEERAQEKKSQVYNRFSELERIIKDSRNKSWIILRTAFYQEQMLKFGPMIQDKGKLSLPLATKKFSPLSVRDLARAISGIHEQTIFKRHERETYTLTGPETLDGQEIARRLKDAVNADIKYEDVQMEDVERYLEKILQRNKTVMTRYFVETFELAKEGRLDKVTKHMEELTGEKAERIDVFFKEHANNFRP